MKKFAIALLLIISFIIFSPAGAQTAKPKINLINAGTLTEMGDNVNNVAGTKGAGYNSSRTLEDIIGAGIKIVTSVLGIIFVSLMFVAGNNWMQAGGNEEKVKKSQKTIRDLLIGLCLCLILYALSTGLGGLISSLLLNN
ncbi:MAG: hypothetical protein WC523_02995 [Patescibacteria group bacterium]